MNQNIKEDFLDILLYLFEYYSEDPVRESDTSFVIRDHLIDAGFQDVAIDHAMDWVEIFKNPKEDNLISKKTSVGKYSFFIKATWTKKIFLERK